MIPDNSWSRTVLHDKAHWRVLTITNTVTCRECTLPRDEKSTDPKGWIQGNTKIGSVLEVTTSYLQSKFGVEIRTESINKDNSHSWVRISHGFNKLVTDLIDKEYDDNEQETSGTKTERFALKTDVLAFCKPIKSSSKTTKTYLCLLTCKNCTYLWMNMGWYWTRNSFQSSIPSGIKTKHFSSAWTITSRRRWCDRILDTERWSSEQIWALNIGLMTCGRARWQEAEATRKYFNIILNRQDKKFFVSELFKVIQDAIPLILHYKTMCAFRTISSSTFIILDVQSVYTPSQIQDW